MNSSPADYGRVSEHTAEQIIGRLLQAGVLLAATLVLIGGAMLLLSHGSTTPDYTVFRVTNANVQSAGQVLHAVAALDPLAIVQLGLLVLIATPIARVALMLVMFVMQRDRLYIAFTALVLSLLLYSFFVSG